MPSVRMTSSQALTTSRRAEMFVDVSALICQAVRCLKAVQDASQKLEVPPKVSWLILMASSVAVSLPNRSAHADTEKGDHSGTASAGSSPSEFPDGGLKAWSVVVGAFCCLFTSFGWINCIGIFENHYQNNELRQYPPSTVAWITSVEVRVE